jgi:hypothetical protein
MKAKEFLNLFTKISVFPPKERKELPGKFLEPNIIQTTTIVIQLSFLNYFIFKELS